MIKVRVTDLGCQKNNEASFFERLGEIIISKFDGLIKGDYPAVSVEFSDDKVGVDDLHRLVVSISLADYESAEGDEELARDIGCSLRDELPELEISPFCVSVERPNPKIVLWESVS